MKKWWLLPALAIVLAACGNNEESQPKEEEEIAKDTIESEEESVTSPDSEIAPEDEPENHSASSASDLSGYEESAVLGEHMPIDKLTSHVETDNPGKRIILFENESGEKVYKSIFIKHDRFLKIIDLKDDQLLYKDKL
ncbi:hypothetical protein [Sporosarcina aquimarina]|uniref:hypothetical protein n=1 Tax=Sporosarcina aquimarina TaxID=114975 RepID=UPI001C8EEA94|nr:hypothetical protein [Sporosarcina aquimarina]MBY0221261.1 hypothetical protein [Sporosarcina aquimarina]